MANLKIIRSRLGVTQSALAAAMGCVQGNIPFYEKGREIPVAKAKLLIAFAQPRGLLLTLDHIYGDEEVPELPEVSLRQSTGA